MGALRSLERQDEGAYNPSAVQVLTPSPPLRAYIRAFEYHPRWQETAEGLLPIWPHPYTLMPIRFGDPVQVIDRRANVIRLLPEAVLAGPVTGPVFDVITRERSTAQFLIVFQPGGALRLFGVPASALTNEALAAEDFIGASVRALVVRMRQARSPAEMVAIAEAFLLDHAAAAPAMSAVERAAQAQLRSRGRLPIAELIRASGYGRARFERTFVDCAGVTPKVFALLVRFDYALRLRAANPALSWIAISHEAGYFDQNHLVKEFKAMTGQLPSRPHDSQWRIAGGDALTDPVPAGPLRQAG
jgi:AraC-like DNA-binding protein